MKVANHAFNVDDKVRLRADVLRRHAQSVPAYLGYTREQFQWRDILRGLAGEIGVIERTFPGSMHVNVQFSTNLIGIDSTELVIVKD